MSKYKAKKITYNGIVFDSKREYHRYRELLMLEKAGQITDLQMQVKYVLIPTQREPDTIGKRGGIKKGKVIEKEVAYYYSYCNLKKSLESLHIHTTQTHTHAYIFLYKT